MGNTNDKPKSDVKSVGDIIGRLSASWQLDIEDKTPGTDTPSLPPSTITVSDPKPIVSTVDLEQSGYYDFDLAEFPWAIFSRSDRPKSNDPLVYSDTIKHPDTQEQIPRTFKTYPLSLIHI